MQITVPGLTHSAILDASPVATSVMDGEGTIIYVNDAFLAHASKVRGKEIRREDRIGRNVQEFIEHNRQEWQEIYDRALKQGESVSLEELRSHLPDREMCLDTWVNPIKGEDGRVIGAVVTWQDVTDRVKRQQEEEELRRRTALDRVRVSVYEMIESADIQKVLTSLYEALKDIGVEFDDCSVAVVDEDKESVESYYLGSDGVHLKDEFPLSGILLKVWQDGQPVYRRDVEEEDIYNRDLPSNSK